MNNQIDVIGNESSVIDYNLNNQFSNVKKIIITSQTLFNSFEDTGVADVFIKLTNSTPEKYRADLSEAALSQRAIKRAPVDIIITGNYAKTMAKYGERGRRYVDIEVGPEWFTQN